MVEVLVLGVVFSVAFVGLQVSRAASAPRPTATFSPPPTPDATLWAEVREIEETVIMARTATPVIPTMTPEPTQFIAPPRLMMTDREYQLLGWLMWLEAQGLGKPGMQSVASTVRARLINTARWGDYTVTDVIMRGCPTACQFGPALTAASRTDSGQPLPEVVKNSLNAYLVWADSPYGCFGYEFFDGYQTRPGGDVECIIEIAEQIMGWRKNG